MPLNKELLELLGFLSLLKENDFADFIVVKDLVDFSERDEIITDLESYVTRTPGLFAAGDCNKGRFKQIIAAAGEGAKATLAVIEYLMKIKK